MASLRNSPRPSSDFLLDKTNIRLIPSNDSIRHFLTDNNRTISQKRTDREPCSCKGRITSMFPHNTAGGGSRTNENGLAFEQEARSILRNSIPNLDFKGHDIIFSDCSGNRTVIGGHFIKYDFIRDFLLIYCPQTVCRAQNTGRLIVNPGIWSKHMEPDNAFMIGNTVNIIEVKYQEVSGSVDEKLQTCDFKRQQYERLLSPYHYQVNYIFFLCNWFSQSAYQDVLNYIINKGCFYFFPEQPEGSAGINYFFAPQITNVLASRGQVQQ